MNAQLALLHLTDSLFPIGSFAHSDGLEWATQSGLVSTPTDLAAWLDVCLDETFGRLEGPAVVEAWSAFHAGSLDRLARLDEELNALRPAATVRRASRSMGLRLLTGWHAAYPSPALDGIVGAVREGQLAFTLPTAFGIACAAAEVDRRSAAEAFAYSRLAATVSAAMRLMPIGQTMAHGELARALGRVPPVVDALVAASRTLGHVESFAPAMDIAAMTQPYLHSRLFLS